MTSPISQDSESFSEEDVSDSSYVETLLEGMIEEYSSTKKSRPAKDGVELLAEVHNRLEDLRARSGVDHERFQQIKDEKLTRAYTELIEEIIGPKLEEALKQEDHEWVEVWKEILLDLDAVRCVVFLKELASNLNP